MRNFNFLKQKLNIYQRQSMTFPVKYTTLITKFSSIIIISNLFFNHKTFSIFNWKFSTVSPKINFTINYRIENYSSNPKQPSVTLNHIKHPVHQHTLPATPSRKTHGKLHPPHFLTSPHTHRPRNTTSTRVREFSYTFSSARHTLLRFGQVWRDVIRNIISLSGPKRIIIFAKRSKASRDGCRLRKLNERKTLLLRGTNEISCGLSVWVRMLSFLFEAVFRGVF